MTPPRIARKRADLLSIVGATIAGGAVGAWFASDIRAHAGALLGVGLIAHAVGMTARHRLDRSEAPLPAAWQALYLLCWLAIGGMLVAVVYSAFDGATG